jgi:hypothetical protein
MWRFSAKRRASLTRRADRRRKALDQAANPIGADPEDAIPSRREPSGSSHCWSCFSEPTTRAAETFAEAKECAEKAFNGPIDPYELLSEKEPREVIAAIKGDNTVP